jgi:hypothetical protein
MPLPIAFWEVESAHQVTFHNPLPEGTEIPNHEGVWAEPRMVRATRFPVGPFLVTTQAHKAVLDAFERDDRAYYLLVAWLWDKWNDPPKVGAAYFRCKTDEILQYGSAVPPDWFRELDEVTRERTVPTALDRLMGDDEL